MRPATRTAILLAACLLLATTAFGYTIDRAIGAYTFGQETNDGYESGYVEFSADHRFVFVVHVDRDRDGVTDSYRVTRGEFRVGRKPDGELGMFVQPDGGEGAFLADPRSDGARFQSFCVFDRCFTRKGSRLGYFDTRAVSVEDGGSLAIQTDPDGALVFIDGERKPGNTPLTVTGLRAGVTHTVRIEHVDHPPLVRTVTVQPRRETRLAVKLPTGKEKVVIRSIPMVNVSVDGTYWGRTPIENMELTPGSYTITLENAGSGIFKEFQLDLEEGEPFERTFKFFGRLSVDVGRPCRVFVGRVDLGVSPFEGERIPAGIQRVRLEPVEGGKPVLVNVRIVVDQDSRVGGTWDNPVVEQPEL